MMTFEWEPWQRELLETARVGHLGTVSTDGRPHLVPVCFALRDAEIFVAVDEKPKRTTDLARLRNIARDARVSLLVDRYDEDWSQLAWVRVEGEASVIPLGGERKDALACLRERYEKYASMDLENRPLIVMRAERVVGWRATGD